MLPPYICACPNFRHVAINSCYLFFKMVDCGCSGIRSCLLCESKKDDKTINLNHGKKLKTLMLCIKCQKLCLETVLKENLCQNTAQTCSEHGCFEDVVSGITVIEDFITEKEEEFIVAEIEKFPWRVSQSGRLKQVGSGGSYIVLPLGHKASTIH